MKRTGGDWTVVDGTFVMSGDRVVADTGIANGAHPASPTTCRLENIANARAIAALPGLAKLADETMRCLLCYPDDFPTTINDLRAALVELEERE